MNSKFLEKINLKTEDADMRILELNNVTKKLICRIIMKIMYPLQILIFCINNI